MRAVKPAAADAYARLKATQERVGIVVDENVLWIAATALALGVILLTRARDFSRIVGLDVEHWTA